LDPAGHGAVAVFAVGAAPAGQGGEVCFGGVAGADDAVDVAEAFGELAWLQRFGTVEPPLEEGTDGGLHAPILTKGCHNGTDVRRPGTGRPARIDVAR
jgi:hypothetical protein